MRSVRSVTAVEVLPVGPDELDRLDGLFGTSRATRHCWCTAFCSTRRQFATGWYGGGNRRRFERMAATEDHPMGLVAFRDDEPVGWCACGPRTRYAAAAAGRSRLLVGRPRDEDDVVWLIACSYVRPDRGATGVAVAMLRAAVLLAQSAGAVAVEAWPLALGVRDAAQAHVGREGVFARLGFRRIEHPHPQRVIMRRELSGPANHEAIG